MFSVQICFSFKIPLLVPLCSGHTFRFRWTVQDLDVFLFSVKFTFESEIVKLSCQKQFSPVSSLVGSVPPLVAHHLSNTFLFLQDSHCFDFLSVKDSLGKLFKARGVFNSVYFVNNTFAKSILFECCTRIE